MFICEHFFIIYGEHFVHNLLCSVPWENGGEIMVKFQANKYVFKQSYANTKKS